MRYTLYSNTAPTPLKINHLGFARDDEGTRFGPGQRECYIIHYVIKGSGVFNGQTVHTGQGFLIRPGQLAEYHRLENDPWEFLWILSNDAQMESIFQRYNADGDGMIFDYGDTSSVKETADHIIKHANSITDPLDLMELFLHIYNSHAKKHPTEQFKPNSEVYLDFCISYIENNIHKKISTTDLTTLLGVSQPYLYKIFQTKFGTNPKDYIISYKMKRAKKMLTETQMTVTQVANSLGYDDSLAFSKAFKGRIGVSPSDYRACKSKGIM